MEIVYKRSDDEHEYELSSFYNEFRNRYDRQDTCLRITIKKKDYEDKTMEIKFRFDCDKEEGDPSYEESEQVEEHMSTSIYYWITLELKNASQFKDLVKQHTKLSGKDKKTRTIEDIQERVEIFLYDIFNVYDQMITRIKVF